MLISFARGEREKDEILSIDLSAEIGHLAIRNELPALSIASDSTVGNCSSNFMMDPSDAELIQRYLHEQRGRVGKYRPQFW